MSGSPTDREMVVAVLGTVALIAALILVGFWGAP